MRTHRRLRPIAAAAAPLVLALATAGAITTTASAASASWHENLAQTHADDVNTTWTGHALGIRDPHTTTVHTSVGYAMDTFPAHALTTATNQLTVTAAVQQPAGSRAEVDVRGQAADGTWTEWTQAAAKGATRLSAPTKLAQTRVTLWAAASGASGASNATAATAATPSVTSIAVTPDPGVTAAAIAPNATTTPLSYKVYATDEGLVGGTTNNGHVIQPNDHFVALPSGSALSPQGSGEYSVQVCGPARCETAPVWDVGPWNLHDNYWDNPRAEFTDLTQGEPEAQAAYDNGYNGGKSDVGSTIVNPAGIDLADGTFANIGMSDNGYVTVTYLWTSGGTPPPSTAYSQGSGGRVATGVHADGRAEVFAVTPSGGIQNKYETSPGGAWSGWNGFGPSGTAVAVAAGRHADGRLEVFAVMSDGSMRNRYETAANGAWSGWNNYAPAGTAKDAVVGIHSDGRLEVFAVTPSGGIQNKYETVADGAWSGWNGFGPTGAVDSVAAARHADGRLEVFAVMTDGSLRNRYETVADGTWSSWNAYAPAGTAEGTGSPGVDAAGVHADGRIEVFAVTPSGGIQNKYETAADGPWSGWNGFGPSGTATSATVVRHSDGRLEVFAVMADGSMRNRFETSPGGAWSGWNGFAPAGTAHT